MLLLKKCIKQPVIPNSLTKFVYKKQKCIALSYGKDIQIIDYSNNDIAFFNAEKEILFITYAFKKDSESLFIVFSDNTFCVMKDNRTIQEGNFFNEYKNSVRPIKLLRTDTFICVVFNSNKIIVVQQKGSKIFLNNSFNFYNTYEIKDINKRNNKIYLLIKDLDKKVYIFNLSLNATNNEIIYSNIENLPETTEKVAFFKNKMILFHKNGLSLYNNGKIEAETNFANLHLNTSLEINNLLYLFMEDGEIINLSITDKISINKIYNFKDKIKDLVKIEGDVFLGVFNSKGRVYFNLTNKFKIIEIKENNSLEEIRFTKLQNIRNKLILQTKRTNFTLNVSNELNFIDSIQFDQSIKKIWSFKHLLFLSCCGKSFIYDLIRKETIKECEELKNVKMTGERIRMNTNNLIIELSESSHWFYRESENILLSDFFDDYSLFYHGSKLSLYLNNTLVNVIEVSLNVSMVMLNTFIFISTFNNEGYFYDLNLNIICKTSIKSMINYAVTNKFIFLLANDNEIYKFSKKSLEEKINESTVLNNNNLNLIKLSKKYLIYKSNYHINSFVIVNNLLLIGGNKPKVIHLKNNTIFKLNNEYINYLTYNNNRIFYTNKNNVLINDNKLMKLIKYDLNKEKKEIRIKKNNLIYEVNNKIIYKLKIPYKVISYFIINNRILIIYNVKDHSEIIIYRLDKGFKEVFLNRCSLIKAAYVYKSTLVTEENNLLIIYKVSNNKLIKKYEYSLEYFCTPKLIISNNKVFIYDELGNNVLLQITNKQIIEKYKFNNTSKIQAAEFYKDNLLISDDNTWIYLINLYDYKISCLYRMYRSLVSIITCRVNENRSKSIYYLTDTNELGIITECKFTSEEKEALTIMYNSVKEKNNSIDKFNYNFIDVNILLKYWNEGIIDDSKVNKFMQKKIINKCNELY
ncbi:hypothetical protein H312_00399 [Anncaliia algerae PRA339]|uniref:Cleavage/polyadenylation specificity factor A subunit C-terminal domain-containing protein n=1 Tax=Anncaliia algerae PRA339 TaxID=1288291 RepID=A0A059F570_9MICR|nr:hypothetical protein H312_00399 [Anncaliia algerae PRA339]